jgi:hypothetical protein
MTYLTYPRRWLLWFVLIGSFTALWYGVGLTLSATGRVTVWDDQTSLFLRMVDHLAAPNRVDVFKNPPWAALLLAPFGLIARSSTALAVLAQLFLYWLGLALLVRKLAGEPRRGLRAYLIAMTSPFALDAALNLNIDWIVVYGLLLPAAYSGPLLLVKPQNALGYVFALTHRQRVRWLTVVLVVFLLSLAIWGPWPLDWIPDANSKIVVLNVNFAPWSVITPYLSIPIGLVLGWFAARRRDPILAILAGAFFFPYIAFYTLLLHFTLIAIRWPRAALIISLALWVVIGIFIVNLPA